MYGHEQDLPANRHGQNCTLIMLGDRFADAYLQRLIRSVQYSGQRPLLLGFTVAPLISLSGRAFSPDITLHALEKYLPAAGTRLVIGDPLPTGLRRDPRAHRLITRILENDGSLSLSAEALALLYTLGLATAIRRAEARVLLTLPGLAPIAPPFFIPRPVRHQPAYSIAVSD